VTYEQDKLAHTKTEFGFDVLEVARERFARTAIMILSVLKLRKPARKSLSGDVGLD